MLFDIEKREVMSSVLLIIGGIGIGLYKATQQEGFHFGVGIVFITIAAIILVDFLFKLGKRKKEK
ncbi:hypothetical protein [Paenibacillus sp. FSL W7-1287]|uniref:hypothetical protein n=1 Tax=Paenibacillus sp. FSL W7-1287 TaxID=2954538 RepID=UPI0030F4C84F